MTLSRTDPRSSEWVACVRKGLRARGYYYEPDFCKDAEEGEPVVKAARLLGELYVPPGLTPSEPAILTQPSPSAPNWRPFDRRGAIGWHNDFSTRAVRPTLSLSWIRTQDPGGGGTWRVASCQAVLAGLCRDREGERFVAALSTKGEPFGYKDGGVWRSFRVVLAGKEGNHRGLRFYGRALREGAWLRFGQVPDRTEEIVTRMQEAADAVGQELPAPTGALLVVDNSLSLHDRTEQQVNGAGQLRQAWLCFVKKLHR